MVFAAFSTRMGWVSVLSHGTALIRTTLPQKSRAAALSALGQTIRASQSEDDLIKRAQGQLTRYLAGEKICFDLPIDISKATAFQRRVWQLTCQIRYGRVRTYADLACAAGHPGAARAVGQCMALNPLPLIIPCHRVVGSAGDLRGFGGGLPMKRQLLEMEGAL